MGADKRISPSDIVVGKPLPWSVTGPDGKLLLRKGYVIHSEEQLQQLVNGGLFVAGSSSASPHDEEPPLKEAKLTATQLVNLLKPRLKKIYRAIIKAGEGGGDISGQISRLATDLSGYCGSDADALLATLHLDNEDYVLTPPLYIAVLCYLFAEQLALSAGTRQILICAALTHDLGMLHIMGKLEKQSAPLTDEQWRIVKQHPEKSVRMLKKAGIEDQTWLTTVLHHHERLDGSGYPQGLQGEAISLTGRILAICDMYSAMVRERPYRRAFPAKDALRDIFMQRGDSIDAQLAQQFIKFLGIFPPGALVRLANGEIAVVVKRGANSTSPIVKSVLGPKGNPYINSFQRDCSDPTYSIAEMLLHRDYPYVANNRHLLWAGH